MQIAARNVHRHGAARGAHPVGEGPGGTAERLHHERVRGYVDLGQVSGPDRIHRLQFRCGATIRKHGPLALFVDEHHDRSGAATPLYPRRHPGPFEVGDQAIPGGIGADAPDERGGVVRCGQYGDIGRAAAPRPMHLHARVAAVPERLGLPDHDVFDEITDHAEPARQHVIAAAIRAPRSTLLR